MIAMIHKDFQYHMTAAIHEDFQYHMTAAVHEDCLVTMIYPQCYEYGMEIFQLPCYPAVQYDDVGYDCL